jgi:sugar lactone lactonase YvrE
MNEEEPGPVQVLGGLRAEVGEGPHWDADSQCLWWVDLLAGLVHCSDLKSGQATTFSVGWPVGAVVARASGGLVAADARGYSYLSPSGEVLERAQMLPVGHRMNDAKTDPAGRLWAGSTTMEFTSGEGAMHVLSPGGAVATVLTGLTLPNGLGWSPAGDTFYLVDSMQGRLRAWDFDFATGEITSPRTLVEFGGQDELPDGLCVDATGTIWVAIWGGSRLERYSPDGWPLGPVPMPVAQPSSCAFAGPGLDILVVTSAHRGLGDRATKLDGALLGVSSPGAVGFPGAKFAG